MQPKQQTFNRLEGGYESKSAELLTFIPLTKFNANGDIKHQEPILIKKFPESGHLTQRHTETIRKATFSD